ncbi:MAG TPA: cyclic nucleotide-binding domain-containing protein, partial [Hanamia sp.]|nr:cyclic nucleotide-binding domain-containing protein [Hanamia sp.]
MSLKGIFPIDEWDFKSNSVIVDLPPDQLTMLTANMSTQAYTKGEIIFREGAYAIGIFLLCEGKAKKYKADKEGKEQIIYVANKGEIMGYHAILAEERY